jgi:hypothetical protein
LREPFTEFHRRLARVTPWAKRKFIQLLLDSSDNFRICEADLVRAIAMKIQIAPALNIFDPRAFDALQSIQARRGKRLV